MDACYMWIPSPPFKTLKAIFFKKIVSTALLNHIRELRMKMGPVSRKLWRPRKLRPPDLRDSGVFLENIRRMLMWWSYFMLNQTAEKKSGLTGIRVYFHLLQMKHFLRRHSISSLKRRRHLKRWRFKWKLREVYWVFHHSNGFYEIVRFLPVRNIQNNVVI